MSAWLTLSDCYLLSDRTLVFRFGFPGASKILLSCHCEIKHVIVCRDGDSSDDGPLPRGEPPGGEHQGLLAHLGVQWWGGEG